MILGVSYSCVNKGVTLIKKGNNNSILSFICVAVYRYLAIDLQV